MKNSAPVAFCAAPWLTTRTGSSVSKAAVDGVGLLFAGGMARGIAAVFIIVAVKSSELQLPYTNQRLLAATTATTLVGEGGCAPPKKCINPKQPVPSVMKTLLTAHCSFCCWTFSKQGRFHRPRETRSKHCYMRPLFNV